ncbi:hypothetical protein R6Q59_032271 [Mikania micrantha]
MKKAIEQAKDSSYEIGKLNTILLTFLEEQSTRTKSKYVQTASQDSNAGSSQVNIIPQISIRDPLVHTNTKGRPKSATRIKSSLEAPKKRSCSYCEGLGHYISGCLKKKKPIRHDFEQIAGRLETEPRSDRTFLFGLENIDKKRDDDI